MATKNQKFSKKEKLSGKKEIEGLFDQGISIKVHPLKILFLVNPDLGRPQVLISIPKRNFRKASARNLLKRRITEAYRINKHLLTTGEGQKPMIAYIYLATESLPFRTIENSVRSSLKKISEKITDAH
jgi:ribonuclease P protein component